MKQLNYKSLNHQQARPLEIEDLFDEDDTNYVHQLNEWLTKLAYSYDYDNLVNIQYYDITAQYIKYILHKHQRIFFNAWYDTVESSWKLSKDQKDVQNIAENIKAFHTFKINKLINMATEYDPVIPSNPYSNYLKKRDQFEYVITMLSKELIKHKPPKPPKPLNRKKEIAYSPDSDLSILLDAA